MPYQSDIHYTFSPILGDTQFEVVSFTLNEAVSTPHQLLLELVSHDNDVDFGHLLDKPVLFTLWKGERPVRHVHGLVSSFSQGEKPPPTRARTTSTPLKSTAEGRSLIPMEGA
ncbi:hypothetical protein HU734_008900 [Pseudomonas wayambapalatensis]|nr:hypothetical protein HU734_008900 [Pseudomonas wayambapalatensis]